MSCLGRTLQPIKKKNPNFSLGKCYFEKTPNDLFIVVTAWARIPWVHT